MAAMTANADQNIRTGSPEERFRIEKDPGLCTTKVLAEYARGPRIALTSSLGSADFVAVQARDF